MGEMAEDRIYADRRDKFDVYVGAALGVTLVAISDDRVGRFRLLRRGDVTAVTATADAVVIGTEEDVFRASTDDPEAFEALAFGPAAAVGGDGPVAASSDGVVARYDGTEWQRLGTVEEPRTIAGEWLAAGDGLYRLETETIERYGPSARDVTPGPDPIAAAADGLFRMADGERVVERDGSFHTVARRDDRVLAVGDEGLIERRDGTWTDRDVPTEERLTDAEYAQGIVAVTDAGTILVDPPAAKDGAAGWRSRSLGLADVTGLAVAESQV